jgi:hypothetical protein
MAKAKAETSLPQDVDRLWALREQIRELAKETKELEGQYTDLEETVIARIESEGTDRSSGLKAMATIKIEEVPKIEDADSFWTYVFRNKARHLLQNRVSAPAWRDEVAARKGKALPGVGSFEKKKLSLSTRS